MLGLALFQFSTSVDDKMYPKMTPTGDAKIKMVNHVDFYFSLAKPSAHTGMYITLKT